MDEKQPLNDPFYGETQKEEILSSIERENVANHNLLSPDWSESHE